jgi:tRNA threonylcarbamoyladenosine modification (KEOPS) complex  Pcc1 subunit
MREKVLSVKQANSLIEIEFASPREAEAILSALLPEVKGSKTSRSEMEVEIKGKVLILKISAKDTTALRAIANSYLRWIATTKEINGLVGGKSTNE